MVFVQLTKQSGEKRGQTIEQDHVPKGQTEIGWKLRMSPSKYLLSILLCCPSLSLSLLSLSVVLQSREVLTTAQCSGPRNGEAMPRALVSRTSVRLSIVS